MRVNSEDLLAGSTLDLSSSYDFKPIWLGHINNFSIQLAYVGSMTGSFRLEASNDHVDPKSNDVASKIIHWTEIEDSSRNVTGDGTGMWTVENAGYTWVRVVWTRASGTGSMAHARAYVKGE